MKKKSTVLYMAALGLVILLSWYVSNYHYQIMRVEGSSMEPTYHDKSIVLLNKHKMQYKTGDIVYCRSEALGTYIVKRVAAVAGDELRNVDGMLYINGQAAVPLPNDEYVAPYISAEGSTVPEGMYFLLGDNTYDSYDSRFAAVGLMPQGEIKGKVITR